MPLGHGDFIVPSFLLDRKVIFTFSAFSIDIILPMLRDAIMWRCLESWKVPFPFNEWWYALSKEC